jgi:hypothetical protein
MIFDKVLIHTLPVQRLKLDPAQVVIRQDEGCLRDLIPGQDGIRNNLTRGLHFTLNHVHTILTQGENPAIRKRNTFVEIKKP